MILRREMIAFFSFIGGFITSYEHAVDAVADAEVLLVRLDVDVATRPS